MALLLISIAPPRVIAVHKDGHNFSDPEREHRGWRVLSVPGDDAALYEGLAATHAMPTQVPSDLPAHAFELDLSHAPVELAAHLAERDAAIVITTGDWIIGAARRTLDSAPGRPAWEALLSEMRGRDV